MSTELKRIIEAMLFVSETPLSKAQIAAVLENVENAEIAAALAELARDYQDSPHAFNLVEVAGGFCFRTKGDYAFWLRKLKRAQATRLSRAAMETLAIVAYRQPIMKAEVEKIRGVEVGSILRMLMEKDLVRTVGRQDLPGRPLIYGTTKKFLEVFDLNDLSDLPTLEELKTFAASDEDELLPALDDESNLPTLQEVEAMAEEDEEHRPKRVAQEEESPQELAAREAETGMEDETDKLNKPTE